MKDKYDPDIYYGEEVMDAVTDPKNFMRWLLNYADKENHDLCIEYLFSGCEDYDTEDSINNLCHKFYDSIYEMLEDEGVIDNSEPYDPHWLSIPMGI